MLEIQHKLKEILDVTKKVRRYRDMRLNPDFLKSEKTSTIDFIIDEEIMAILKEDELYQNTRMKDLLNLRDFIVSEYAFTDESLENIDFNLLLNGSSDLLLALRIYKELEYLVTEQEVRDIVDDRFASFIREYLKDELSEEEFAEIKRECDLYNDKLNSKKCDADNNFEVSEFIIKRKLEDEILSNYAVFLDSYLSTLDIGSKEYKDISRFIRNMFFVNKNLERGNEFFYNRYQKVVPLSLDSLAQAHKCSKESVDFLMTTVLFDSYDYGVELFFRKPKCYGETIGKLINIYLATIQSMISKNDVCELFTIIDDNYCLSEGVCGKYSNSDKVKTDLENNIYLNEEKGISGKTYIKR